MNKQHTTLPAIRRRNHYDVTDRVRISHPDDVCAAVCALLAELHPQADLAALRHAFKTFGRLYAGTLPGRSEARRVGKECVSTCSSRWSPYHYKKQTRNQSPRTSRSKHT